MESIGLRPGNHVWYKTGHGVEICTIDGVDLRIMDEDIVYAGDHSPIELTEEILREKLDVNIRENVGGVEIRKACLQVGFVFCFRKTALRFFRFVHEYENLYFDIKGRFPEFKY